MRVNVLVALCLAVAAEAASSDARPTTAFNSHIHVHTPTVQSKAETAPGETSHRIASASAMPTLEALPSTR